MKFNQPINKLCSNEIELNGVTNYTLN